MSVHVIPADLRKLPPLTPYMYRMLVEANGCSLPGDGWRIKGSGPHGAARALERLGYVRVVATDDGRKARVHVTSEGRTLRERLAQVFMGAPEGTSR